MRPIRHPERFSGAEALGEHLRNSPTDRGVIADQEPSVLIHASPRRC
jgi:hypothetical protein